MKIYLLNRYAHLGKAPEWFAEGRIVKELEPREPGRLLISAVVQPPTRDMNEGSR